MTKTVKLKIELTIPFEDYKNKKWNLKAKNHIKKWVKDTMIQELSYIPLYVEKYNGSWIEDSTGLIKNKVSGT